VEIAHLLFLNLTMTQLWYLPVWSRRSHKNVWRLQTHVPVQRSYVSEHPSTRFALVNARTHARGAHPGFLLKLRHDLSSPVCTSVHRWAEVQTRYTSAFSFPQQEHTTEKSLFNCGWFNGGNREKPPTSSSYYTVISNGGAPQHSFLLESSGAENWLRLYSRKLAQSM
jgi:hypothetical protein